MFGDRQELDVREPQLVDVLDELVGEFAVAETRPPRADVHLVHAHRGVVRVVRGALGEPGGVVPLVLGLRDLRPGRRRHLGGAGHRVGAGDPLAGRGEDLELVRRVREEPRDEQFPDAVVVEPAHRVQQPRPGVEVPDDAHRLRVRRPDREARALDALVRAEVRAEHVPELLVAALAPEVEIDLADARHEAVRVARDPVRSAVVAGLEVVALAGVGRDALPQPVGDVAERDPAAVGAHGRHGRGERPQCADDPAASGQFVLPEPVVGSRVPGLDERGDQAGVEREVGCGDVGGLLLGGGHELTVPSGRRSRARAPVR